MAWRLSGDKPLSEPMMVGLPTHICVTRPQWVKDYFVLRLVKLLLLYCRRSVGIRRFHIPKVYFDLSSKSLRLGFTLEWPRDLPKSCQYREIPRDIVSHFEWHQLIHIFVWNSRHEISWHDDGIKWKHYPRYWSFVPRIHRSTANSPHEGQWRGALVFSLICAWINDWVNNREAGDLGRHLAQYGVTVMWIKTLRVLRPCTRHGVKAIFANE